MITGPHYNVDDVTVIGRLSPVSMLKIVKLLDQKSVSFFRDNVEQPQTNVSDRTSSISETTLNDSESVSSHGGTGKFSAYEEFLANCYQLERFLDFAYMSFDEVDYTMIRDYLNLPKKTYAEPNILNCDCNDHKKKSVHSDDEETRNFWRTLDKMIRCADKLRLNMHSSETLSRLNTTSRITGFRRTTLSIIN